MTTGNHSTTPYRRLPLLFALILIGVTTLVAIHATFHKQRTRQEHAADQTRIQLNLAHQLSEQIKGVQTLYFLWPTLTTDAQQQAHTELTEHIDQIFKAIRILEYGGPLPFSGLQPDLATDKNTVSRVTSEPGQHLDSNTSKQLRTGLQNLFRDIEELQHLLQKGDRTPSPEFMAMQTKDSAILASLYGITRDLIATIQEYLTAQEIAMAEQQADAEQTEGILFALILVIMLSLTWTMTRRITPAPANGSDAEMNRSFQEARHNDMRTPREPGVILHMPAQENHSNGQTPAPDPIDYETGLEKVGGDKDFFNEILQDFVALHGKEGELLLHLFEKKEFTSIQERAHRLKGVAGTISAHAFARQAEHLEHLAGDTPPDSKEIERTIYAVQERINEILNTLAAPTPAEEHLSAEG